MNKKLLALFLACFLPVALLAGSGDVNGDGKIDEKDINLIAEYIMGKSPANFNKDEADVNNDTEIDVGKRITTIEYDYPNFHLSMDCFLAYVTEGNLVLKEHEAAKWLSLDEIDSVDWLPADVEVVNKIRSTCKYFVL